MMPYPEFFWGLALLGLRASGAAAEVWREDFASVEEWQARPDWLGNPSTQPTVGTEGGVADFAVPEPDRGMKWVRPLPSIYTEEARYAVLRYRAVNYHPTRGDYLLWWNDGRPEGNRVLKAEDLHLDGDWHVQVIDLQEQPSGVLTQLAVQVQAEASGDAHLFLDFIAFTESLPEGVSPPPLQELPLQTVPLPLSPADWEPQFNWLGNPSDHPQLEATEEGLRFWVPEAGRGMKWSRAVPEAVNTAEFPFLTLRYRAQGLQAYADYFLYLADQTGGAGPTEARPWQPGDLQDDGAWHVKTVRLPPMTVRQLALQVQAREPRAWVEVASLRFSNRRPPLSLAETLTFQPGWPTDLTGFKPLDLTQHLNVGPESLLGPLGYEGTWFPQAEVTVEGIPFRVQPTGPALAATSLKETDRLTFPVGQPAGVLYLLLGARFIGPEEPSIGSGELTQVRHTERFVVQLDYADGRTDFIFPYRYGNGRHLIGEELAVYGVEPTRPEVIREVTLHDGMRQGRFFLAAATVGTQRRGDPEGDRTRVSWPLHPLPLPLQPGVTGGGTHLGLERNRLTQWANLATRTEWLTQAGPLFEVQIGEQTVSGEALAEGAVAGVRAELRAEPAADGVALTLTLTNVGSEPVKVRPTFPRLRGISPGGDPADLGYCYPQRGAVIGSASTDLRMPYSGLFPLQFMAVDHPQAGGVFLLTHDRDDTFRWFRLKKEETVTLSVEYPAQELAPGASWTLPEAVLGAHAGDWHVALQAYRDWLQTWYRPAAPRKEWFRQIFNFRQQFLHFALPRPSGLFDNETQTFHVQEVLEQDAAAFGGVDYLHLFDWGWSEEFGRCGDYDHWEQLGGVENFRRAVATAQERGIPVGLYIEGYLVDPPSNLGKAHGAEWQLLKEDGTPYTFFAPSYHLCPHVPAWQDYLAATYGRVARETGADGFYIDEFGFGAHYICYNPAHGHEIPAYPIRGELALTRKVRAALGPEKAIYTEETPTDFNSQFQDGSFTYAISQLPFEGPPINLTRFALPDFKTIEIITCDRPLGSDVQSVKRIFFNGEAIWLEGIAEDWFTPETRAFIARMHRVQKAHRAAFTSLSPRPLVPTLQPKVYANEFPTEGETVWTLYNGNWSTVRGEILAVPHREGVTYYDAWNDRPLRPRIAEGKAFLELEIGPRDVGCVVAGRGEWRMENGE
jgi:hypothetical protein